MDTVTQAAAEHQVVTWLVLTKSQGCKEHFSSLVTCISKSYSLGYILSFGMCQNSSDGIRKDKETVIERDGFPWLSGEDQHMS